MTKPMASVKVTFIPASSAPNPKVGPGLKMPAKTLGLDAISNLIAQYGEIAAKYAVPEAMNNEAKGTMELARDTYCPIDTGALRSTGRVTGFTQDKPDGAIEFGDNGVTNPKTGKEVDYALYVHEILARHESPTQWKYLERAIRDREGSAMGRIAADLKRMLDL